MKKFLLIFFTSLTFLFLFSGTVNAWGEGCHPALHTDIYANGLVPCGISHKNLCQGKDPANPGPWSIWTAPVGSTCENTAPAGFTDISIRGIELTCPCELGHFFILINNVYNFIVWNIATPLATLMIVIGGILMLLSGINANWFNTGKNMVKWSIIAILLIWSAVLIIDTIFGAIGYKPATPWNVFP